MAEPTRARGKRPAAPEGFRAKGRLASLLLSRRSKDILLRRASPSGLFPENSAPRSFQTGSLGFVGAWHGGGRGCSKPKAIEQNSAAREAAGSLRAGIRSRRARRSRPARLRLGEQVHVLLSSFIGCFHRSMGAALSLAVDPNTLEYAHLVALEQTRSLEGPCDSMARVLLRET